MAESLATIISILSKYLPSGLVSDESREAVLRLAAYFDEAHKSMLFFETVLSDESADVDFAFGIYPGFLQHIFDRRDELVGLESSSEVNWQTIIDFFRTWQDDPFLRENLGAFWLEYDLCELRRDCHVPGIVFFPFPNERIESTYLQAHYKRIFTEFLGPFLKKPLSETWIDNLEKCVTHMNRNVELGGIGYPIIRDTDKIRLGINIYEERELYFYLNAIGLGHRIPEVEEHFSELFDEFDYMLLHIDVHEVVDEKISIELRFKPVFTNMHDHRWHRVLGLLAERGLCTHEKCEALRSWPGVSREMHVLLCNYDTRRVIAEVKIVFEPGKKPFVKGYFGFVNLG